MLKNITPALKVIKKLTCQQKNYFTKNTSKNQKNIKNKSLN